MSGWQQGSRFEAMDSGFCQDASDTQSPVRGFLNRAFLFQRDRPEVDTVQLPFPPISALATFGWRRESITIVERPHEVWPSVGEWICPQQSERRGITLEQLDDECHEPGLLIGRAHRRKPHQPIEPEVVRCNLRRPSGSATRFTLELVFAPVR